MIYFTSIVFYGFLRRSDETGVCSRTCWYFTKESSPWT
ncbi:hypothetical protein RHOER0001_3089 [Rhodococcus erythropolis SK121]|nr:hypothetical protein RHOER0001_3089 [Rhodococcus erythropolis SK121]